MVGGEAHNTHPGWKIQLLLLLVCWLNTVEHLWCHFPSVKVFHCSRLSILALLLSSRWPLHPFCTSAAAVSVYTVHCPQKASVPSDCVYTHHYHHHFYYYYYWYYYYYYFYYHYTYIDVNCGSELNLVTWTWTVVYQTDLGSAQLQPSWAFNCQSRGWLQW